MSARNPIPEFSLFGETEGFPDAVHFEDISARASRHDWQIVAHRHAHLVQLFVITSGRVVAFVDGEKLELARGDYLFVPALCVHGFEFVPETAGHVISVPSSVIVNVTPSVREFKNALSRPVQGTIDPTFRVLVDQVRHADREGGVFRMQRMVGAAFSLFALVAEQAADKLHPEHSGDERRMHRLDTLINQHMHEGWSASDYASALSVTTGHLSRQCRSRTGMGAAAYVEKFVMEEACRLLAFTQMPVSQICYRLGYSDPSYFTKRFQKALKQTPSDYRAKFLA